MKTSTRGTVAFTLAWQALAWLALAAAPAARQARPGEAPPEKGAKGRAVSGRVLDGLGRPLPGVEVKARSHRTGREKDVELILRTGPDGAYAGTFPPGEDDPMLVFEREGHDTRIMDASPGRVTILKRKVDWDETSMLPDRDGDELDRGLREVLASEEWESGDGEALGFLFQDQDFFRPALRRLVRDDHVGADARDWLDLLDDPGDRDLFPKGRPYAPKKEVKETDLVEALKAAALQRNFFSSAPEPMIAIDFLKLTRGLDRALIQCGINRAAMTGITWRFVFRKAGKQWKLRSAKQAGRS